jgi:uncharacterized membrane protein YeaQ/YmgE (transglycosylase-associated protein family)
MNAIAWIGLGATSGFLASDLSTAQHRSLTHVVLAALGALLGGLLFDVVANTDVGTEKSALGAVACAIGALSTLAVYRSAPRRPKA